MKETFDPTKPVRYVTSAGSFLPARIVATDRKSKDGGLYPVVALVESSEGHETVTTFTEDGYAYAKDDALGGYRGERLENIPEKRKLWLNVYRDGGFYAHKSRESADRGACRNTSRIACVEVEFDEGEGL